MIHVLLTLATLIVYGWLALIEYRTRRPRARHAQVDPRTRPLRVLAHGRHEAPRKTGRDGKAVAA